MREKKGEERSVSHSLHNIIFIAVKEGEREREKTIWLMLHFFRNREGIP